MCSVSMVTDHYIDKWHQNWPTQPFPTQPTQTFPAAITHPVTRAEFEDLKRDVTELKALLIRAKEYDERTGQADCENDEKMAVIRKVAELVGINLDDVIGKPTD